MTLGESGRFAAAAAAFAIEGYALFPKSIAAQEISRRADLVLLQQG